MHATLNRRRPDFVLKRRLRPGRSRLPPQVFETRALFDRGALAA